MNRDNKLGNKSVKKAKPLDRDTIYRGLFKKMTQSTHYASEIK